MSIQMIPRRAWIAIVVVLAASLLWQANELRIDRGTDGRRDAAVELAKNQVIDLTTLDTHSVDAKLKTMAARTSGDFRQQLSGITATFAGIVKKNSISAEGTVDSVGVTALGDTDATILVASSASIRDGKSKPTARTYRMRVKLERSGGTWKINGMEFVQ